MSKHPCTSTVSAGNAWWVMCSGLQAIGAGLRREWAARAGVVDAAP